MGQDDLRKNTSTPPYQPAAQARGDPVPRSRFGLVCIGQIEQSTNFRIRMAEWMWQRLVRGCRRLWQHDDWARALPTDWPEHIMAVDVTDRFHAKQGRSTG